jgi:RNase H-fold protein (predicted Holliday junction resolvase)
VKWDERFSTKQVHQTLREMNVKKKQRQSKEMIDAMAAAVMLQSYLDR